MKIQTTRPFDEDYKSLPKSDKARADKQFALFLENPHHPSLQIKKIKAHPNLGRQNYKKHSFYFSDYWKGVYLEKDKITQHPEDTITITHPRESAHLNEVLQGLECAGMGTTF